MSYEVRAFTLQIRCKDSEHFLQFLIAGLIPLLVQIFQDRFKASHLTRLREVVGNL